jgi:hypothetical protein
MNRFVTSGIVALAAGAAASYQAVAMDAATPVDDPHANWLPLGLESYEPSAFGHQKNNDDVSFENIKLSVKFPLLPKLAQKYENRDQVFFSFTGVWDFYIGTRPSGPVVGKEYNPQLFWQHNLVCNANGKEKYRAGPTYGSSPTPVPTAATSGESTDSSSSRNAVPRDCYVTVGYNHDSNGQIINSPGQFRETQRAQGTEAALDAISRGWDYIGITGKYIFRSDMRQELTVYPVLKYFLNDGLLQGEPEELHYWEHPSDGKPRKEVDGIGVIFKYQHKLLGTDSKVVLAYDTGYQDAFRFSTVRVEAGIKVFELPIVFWTEKGYMADLSQWYRNVRSYGVEIEIGGF